MMNGEREQMFPRPETHEPPAHERAGPEIKRAFRLFVDQMGLKIGGARSAEVARVESWQIEHQTRSDELTELASFAFKSRAERLVPGNDFVQGSAEHGLIERPVPAQREAHIERWIAARLQLIEQPKASLRGSRGKNEDACRVRCSHVAFAIDFRCDRRRRQAVGMSVMAHGNAWVYVDDRRHARNNRFRKVAESSVIRAHVTGGARGETPG